MLLTGSIRKNSSSTLLFNGRSYGTGVEIGNDLALWTWTLQDGLELAVCEGDTAIGLPEGLAIGEFGGFAIAEDGTIAFIADVAGPDVDFTNDTALFLMEPGDEPRMLLRSGDLFDVDPEAPLPDERTLEDFGFSIRNTFADDSRLLVSLRFDDATHALVTFAPRPGPCPGDFNGDNVVDLGDYGLFGSAFGSVAGDMNYVPEADIDQDGDVDLGDFGQCGADFGRTDCLP